MCKFCGEKKKELSDYCGEKGKSQVYFVKSSKSDTQHDFHEILLTRLLKHHKASLKLKTQHGLHTM